MIPPVAQSPGGKSLDREPLDGGLPDSDPLERAFLGRDSLDRQPLGGVVLDRKSPAGACDTARPATALGAATTTRGLAEPVDADARHAGGRADPPCPPVPPAAAWDALERRLGRVAEQVEHAVALLDRTLAALAATTQLSTGTAPVHSPAAGTVPTAFAPVDPATASPAPPGPSPATVPTGSALPDAPAALPAAGPAAGLALAEILSREADHRVANNLQIVATLLHRQAQAADSDAVRDALNGAGARVAAIGRLHVALRPPDLSAPSLSGPSPACVDLHAYLADLCATLAESTGAEATGRVIRVELQPCSVPPLAAQRLGLLVTELVTNALRHALPPTRPGTVRVHGAPQPGGGYRLCVEDDGCGLPRDFDLRLRRSGLGLRMALMCADQLQARLTAEPHPRAGARFTLLLPATPAPA